jgi:hypothetical protein
MKIAEHTLQATQDMVKRETTAVVKEAVRSYAVVLKVVDPTTATETGARAVSHKTKGQAGTDVFLHSALDTAAEAEEHNDGKLGYSGNAAPTECHATMRMPKLAKVHNEIGRVRVGFSRDELACSFLPLISTLERNPATSECSDRHWLVGTSSPLWEIKQKLDDGGYKDPWQVCNDVRVRLKSASASHRKASRMHTVFTKLADLFDSKVDPIMRSLHFCCGQQRSFTPVIFTCAAKRDCTIQWEAPYKLFEKGKLAAQRYCLRCFQAVDGDTITLFHETRPKVVPKSMFVNKVHHKIVPEPMVECTICGRLLHTICQLWHSNATKPFECTTCQETMRTVRQQCGEEAPSATTSTTSLTAEKLQRTELGDFLEARVRTFLNASGIASVEDQQVTVRVVSIAARDVHVNARLREYYKGGEGGSATTYPERFEGRSKASHTFP